MSISDGESKLEVTTEADRAERALEGIGAILHHLPSDASVALRLALVEDLLDKLGKTSPAVCRTIVGAICRSI